MKRYSRSTAVKSARWILTFPETIIYIVEGIVATLELEYMKSLSSFITAWEKKQAVRTLAIEVPKDLNDKALREHLKAVGARLL
jgi:hypothetical protein